MLFKFATTIVVLLAHATHAQKDKDENGDSSFDAECLAATARPSRQETASKASAAKRPHIVLALFDDLGYHDLGKYDSISRHQCKTPVMDHLMSTGIRLKNFYSMPICSPTRAAILTGRYPVRYGGHCGTPPGLAADQGWAPLGEPMLAERMREAGYITKMAGKWHMGYSNPKITPTGRGFSEFFGKYSGGGDHWTHVRSSSSSSSSFCRVHLLCISCAYLTTSCWHCYFFFSLFSSLRPPTCMLTLVIILFGQVIPSTFLQVDFLIFTTTSGIQMARTRTHTLDT